MSKTNLFAALLIAAAVAPAFGQSGPMTIQEWTNRQADIKRAEMDAKLDEQRKKMNVATPAQIARTCDEDISMFAVYGIGQKLSADFGYRGATMTLAPGGSVDVGGWFVEELTPTRALLVKRSGKKIVARCPVYLSTSIKAPAATTGATMTATADLQVPPIAPISDTPAKQVTQDKPRAQGAAR